MCVGEHRLDMRFRPLLMFLGAVGSVDVSAAGRCAYVDVSLFGMAESKQQCFSLEMTCGPGEEHGCFPTPLSFKDGWIDGGARGKLRELSAPFSYIDREGVHWDVPAGYQTDGATIPMFFQPVIGGRWTDSYINAAVVHDFYIRRSTVDADAVHQMFYMALLAAGNSQRRAQDMFFAVKKFGPQWKHTEVGAYEAAWQARKSMLDRVTKWHQEVWEAFQASEWKREQQAAIDSASLSRPIRERTHVFRLPASGEVTEGLDAFIEGAVVDHIIHPDRDATLLKTLATSRRCEVMSFSAASWSPCSRQRFGQHELHIGCQHRKLADLREVARETVVVVTESWKIDRHVHQTPCATLRYLLGPTWVNLGSRRGGV
jgi:hypothetical protein